MYSEIDRRLKGWHSLWEGHFLTMMLIFVLVAVFMMVIIVGIWLGWYPPPSGPHPPLSPILYPWIGIPVLTVALLLVFVGVRSTRRTWSLILAGQIPRRSYQVRIIEKDVWKRTGRRLWEESDLEAPGGQPSDLTRAILMMRLGSYFSVASDSMLLAVVFSILFFGGMSVLNLILLIGSLFPMGLGFLPTLLFGSFLVLGLALWILLRGIRDSRRLERAFSTLAYADVWLERSFWTRY